MNDQAINISEAMTVVELRRECKKRKLLVGGRKAELIERLTNKVNRDKEEAEDIEMKEEVELPNGGDEKQMSLPELNSDSDDSEWEYESDSDSVVSLHASDSDVDSDSDSGSVAVVSSDPVGLHDGVRRWEVLPADWSPKKREFMGQSGLTPAFVDKITDANKNSPFSVSFQNLWTSVIMKHPHTHCFHNNICD